MGSIMAENSLQPVKAENFAKLGMAAYRAPSLFQPHRLREAIRDAHDGKIPPLMGYFMGLPSPALTKMVALFGFDVVWIDWEHSAMNVETMTQVSTKVHC
jgi:4-hydroxy-2-oxoheptanedioate aldolase